jgi:hypothetical protein
MRGIIVEGIRVVGVVVVRSGETLLGGCRVARDYMRDFVGDDNTRGQMGKGGGRRR